MIDQYLIIATIQAEALRKVNKDKPLSFEDNPRHSTSSSEVIKKNSFWNGARRILSSRRN